MGWNFGTISRTNVADVEPVVASLKTMNDRTLTSGESQTKVGLRIRNGEPSSCVGMYQDGFGFVKQASIGASKIDHGMESNDGRKMDQEWNQVFEMVERAELSDFVVNSSLKFAGSTAPPNLTQHSNYTGSIRSALCERSPPNHIIVNQKVSH